ncbi:MAG: phage major capsid protein, partial [Deltaproteobacteria bacterium]|nr:phage major capsid protein [Deltaproteobacteria bacterium]
MTPEEMKKNIDEMNTAFVEFKKQNNELIEQKAKGAVDALLNDQVEKMSANIASLQSKIDMATRTAESAEVMAKRRYEVDVPETQQELNSEQKLIQKYSTEYYKNVPQKNKETLKNGMLAYMKGGIDNISAEQKHAMSSYGDPMGGYLITPELDREITKFLIETSPIRQVARIRTVSTDMYEKPQRTGRPAAVWRNRETPVSSDTAAPTYGKIQIKVHDVDARPLIPSNLINDSYADVEAEVREALAEEFSAAENNAFVTGDGDGQPRGFLNYPAGNTYGKIEQINSGSGSALTPDGIRDLIGSL